VAGIYLHIPFCKQACNYCDFHFSTVKANKDAVVRAMLREIDLRHTYLPGSVLNSIYLGGGTPSLLSADEIENLITHISRYFTWEKSAEITLEANPDDISKNVLSGWRNNGINRLSIGLQSFNDDELKWMNRAHSASESLDAVKLAQDSGFENISIDLIYGSRFQSLSDWEKTLQTAIGLNTRHISSYNLTIENKTALGTLHIKGREPAIDDELSTRQFLLMKDMLTAAGFIHYEISNFGKQGYLAVHNSNYWKGHHYLGIGPSAHSYNGASRQWNVRNNNLYLKAVNQGNSYFETEVLNEKDKYNEYVLTRLRTIWGCDLEEMMKLFNSETIDHFKNKVEDFKDFIIRKNQVYVLNDNGQLQADRIAADLFI
jgi:oxygen-independent coproporphyrinogen III oxidase